MQCKKHTHHIFKTCRISYLPGTSDDLQITENNGNAEVSVGGKTVAQLNGVTAGSTIDVSYDSSQAAFEFTVQTGGGTVT